MVSQIIVHEYEKLYISSFVSSRDFGQPPGIIINGKGAMLEGCGYKDELKYR